MYSDSKESSGPHTVPVIYDEEAIIILKTLGQDNIAKVMLTHHHLTDEPVTVKVRAQWERWFKPVIAEAVLVTTVNHPNIVSFIQVSQTKQHTFLILKVTEGEELFHHVQETSTLKEAENPSNGS